MIEVVWETIPPFVLCVVYVVLCVFRMFKIRVLANIETKEFERIEKISCKIITDREAEPVRRVACRGDVWHDHLRVGRILLGE